MGIRLAPIVRGLSVALLALLVACQTTRRVGDVRLPDDSALLAVEVRFPATLRDPSLVNAYFVRGPIHGGLARLPEPVQATFVKDSRAYLVDPEPGTWSLVAASHAYAPPRRREPVAGVFDTVASEGDVGRLVVLSSPLIERTRTTIAPGRFAFMGALTLREGERVNAGTRFRDVLQERLAETLRPGATTQSGLAGRFSVTFTVDLHGSSVARGDAALQSFLGSAPYELGASPWADFLPLPASIGPLPPEPSPTAQPDPAPEPSPTAQPDPAPEPSPTAQPDPAPDPAPEPAAPPEPARATVVQPGTRPLREPQPGAERTGRTPIDAPEAPAPAPSPPPVPTVEPTRAPPDPGPVAVRTAPEPGRPLPEAAPPPRRDGGPLPEIGRGMSHDRVRALLGEPDARETYITGRALIPFYTGPGTHERIWSYRGRGKVVFDLNSRTGALRVLRVEPPDPGD